MRRRVVLALALAAASLGCKSERARKASAEAPAPNEVTVFAAASLREAFTELGHALESTHPGAHVVLAFAGSQSLRAQIEQGAPADVFASADERHMGALAAAGHVREPRVFANNELVVIIARAKASTLRTLADLPNAERLVVGAPEVPVGAYTGQMLEEARQGLGGDFRARVEARVVSREPDVRQVLAKVELGEADAGIVYRTDALTAGAQVTVVSIPTEYNRVASYPIAVTASTKVPDLAQAFVDLVVSTEGARVLKQRGFTPVGEKAATP
jgi:molybdate transport system substrate-binding protein